MTGRAVGIRLGPSLNPSHSFSYNGSRRQDRKAREEAEVCQSEELELARRNRGGSSGADAGSWDVSLQALNEVVTREYTIHLHKVSVGWVKVFAGRRGTDSCSWLGQEKATSKAFTRQSQVQDS